MKQNHERLTITDLAFEFLVLAGGAGRRMGGVDKPLMQYKGDTMIQRVLGSVPAVPKHISANRNLEAYARYCAVFTDDEVRKQEQLTDDCRNPLVGVLGGLRRCQANWLLVSPGDTPELTAHWFTPLLEESHNDESLARVIHDGEQQQHLHLLLNTSLADGLKEYLLSGSFQVWRWLEQIDAQPRQALDHSEFTNVNTPDVMPRSD